MEKHSNNLHCLIHVILDFSLSFVQILFSHSFSLFPPLSLSLSVSLSLFRLPSFFLAGIQFHTWGSRMRGRSGLCQQRPAFFFFIFFSFSADTGRKRDLSVPFLVSFTRSPTSLCSLSHTSRHWFLPSGLSCCSSCCLSEQQLRVTSENDLSFITLQPLNDEYHGKNWHAG